MQRRSNVFSDYQASRVSDMRRPVRAPYREKNLLIYADSNTNADMFYATKFSAPDPFIYIRTKVGRRHIVVGDLEIDRARGQANAHRIHSLPRYVDRAKERTGRSPRVADVIAEILRELRIRSVAVPPRFPVGVADGLRRCGIRLRALHEPVFPERIYKTPAEITEIKRAMRASEKGLKAAIEVLRSSRIRRGHLYYGTKRLDSERLRGIINTTVLAAGCLPSGTIVAHGAQACDPHERGFGPIRANEPVIIDVFPRSERSGYFADMTRTVVRGRAPEVVRRMFRAVYDGQRLALRLIRHGVRARDIHTAIQELFEKRGFATGRKGGRMEGFFHGTGHGLGLEIHEPPRIGYNSNKLETGMVVTVEPGLYYHPYGGVRIEDTVVVGKTGVTNLTRFPKFLEI